jgi:hypothetical protein
MSEETKDTAASPESEETKAATEKAPKGMTEKERIKLRKSQHKASAEAAEAAAKAEAEYQDNVDAHTAKNAEMEIFHVLVRHMARSPRTRTLRAGRAGHRRQGVLLDDGTRIRKRGRGRYTQVDLTRFAQNHTRLLEYIRTGAIEVCDPKTEQPIPYEGVKELLGSVAGHVNDVLKDRAMNKYHRDVELHEEAMKVFEEKTMPGYEEALKAWKKKASAAKKSGAVFTETAPPEPVPPAEPEEPKEFDAIEFDESGLQETELVGSTDYNTAPDPEIELEEEVKDGEGEPRGDPTLVDATAQARAAADQEQAAADGEANPPPEETDSEGDGEEDEREKTSYTEEELLEMGLQELKDLAVNEYGCDEETVNKMRAKKDVVTSIFAASGNQEGEE